MRHTIAPARLSCRNGQVVRLRVLQRLRLPPLKNALPPLTVALVLLSFFPFRSLHGKGSGFLDTVVGSDSLDSDLPCLILR
jgi:hypothetical protein